MADTLNIYGVTYSGVTGIKAKDQSDNTLTYTRVSGTKNITENGNNIDVAQYEAVNVAVPGTTPTGTKSITITSNTTTTEDVTDYATASIVTNVPNTYSAGDEGKVVSNGALVAQTSDTVTQNGTVDTTLINSLTVNVPSQALTAFPYTITLHNGRTSGTMSQARIRINATTGLQAHTGNLSVGSDYSWTNAATDGEHVWFTSSQTTTIKYNGENATFVKDGTAFKLTIPTGFDGTIPFILS